ncbi:MAG: NADP-specific glutamate dehydrogenase [Bacteroidales bacterium]
MTQSQLLLDKLEQKFSTEPEYIQAITEFFNCIEDVYESNIQYQKANILERIALPDKIIEFQVPWHDDNGTVHVNTGYRVQFNNVLGPYKGGLRFHPSVNLSILKFLGFEQVFKNSLTTLPLGGGKGGADFDSRGKSEPEIMRFCQSFMLRLWADIGQNIDIPAGDIGVGKREIGYLYGMYKRLTRQHVGVITGKGIDWGGSKIRPEATGYGVIYFLENMLASRADSIVGKRIIISGFGNVAWGAVKKANELGAKIIAISGPDGFVHDPHGICGEKIEFLLALRSSNNDVIRPLAEKFHLLFDPHRKPWNIPCDIAIPCATQNEITEIDVQHLIKNRCQYIVEGANMPCSDEAQHLIKKSDIIYAPGKASNAGGVAVSGLEMTQNSERYTWASEGVDDKLRRIMYEIHETCCKHGKKPDNSVDYVEGANIASFIKVANAMCDLGI